MSEQGVNELDLIKIIKEISKPSNLAPFGPSF